MDAVPKEDQIVWGKFKRGKWKERPAVILDVDMHAGEAHVIVGSTIYFHADSEFAVELDYGKNGKPHPRTKLHKQTFVYGDWVEAVSFDRLKDFKFGGFITPASKRKIHEAIRRALNS